VIVSIELPSFIICLSGMTFPVLLRDILE